MAITATAAIAAVGLGLSAAGTAAQVIQQQEVTKQSKKAEGLRKAQVELDAARKRRQEIRRLLQERGRVINAGAVQGALDSSPVIGGAGSAVSNAGSNIEAIDQAQGISNKLFETNERISDARGRSAIGQGLQSFGSSLVQNQSAAGRVASQLFSVG